MTKEVLPNDHHLSHLDCLMVDSIENNQFQLANFSHEVHVKLAYCYLVQLGLDQSVKKMQSTLKCFLHSNGVDPNKFHMTLTAAWVKAIWCFMKKCPAMGSSDQFIKNNPNLLNKNLLQAHYSDDLLYSEQARKKYIHPDLFPFSD